MQRKGGTEAAPVYTRRNDRFFVPGIMPMGHRETQKINRSGLYVRTEIAGLHDSSQHFFQTLREPLLSVIFNSAIGMGCC
jgi:hypothetical protein